VTTTRLKILKSISYFDIFNHPLKKDELINLCTDNGAYQDFVTILDKLVDEEVCFKKDEYYSLNKDIANLVELRKVNQIEAKKYFRKLPFYVRIIKSFPFVRGVAISGSLSKNIMLDDGDIDYFIVTAPDRLWICRTLLIFFKKVFLFNSRKYFCLNYFVDENNLKIVDENIFTAIEITHMLPVYNTPLIKDLKETNSWTKQYFPNFRHPINLKPIEGRNGLKSFAEWFFKGSLGDRLDLYFMRITLKRWLNKFRHFDSSKFELTMRTNRGVSKHHPQDFQNKVLEEYNVRLNKLDIIE